MRRITLLLALLAFTTVHGTEMRTTRFRNVLWSVARKAGFSPESGNFLSNQAIPVGEYINDYVTRLYSQEDWPEWTKIIRVSPNSNHVVPWQYVIQQTDIVNDPAISILQLNGIGRVLAVYLTNPALYNPQTTQFKLLEDGIHCGFEHGTYVWIKYMEPPPTFTAAVWRSDFTYQRFDTVYSPRTGECYRSLINNNLNHDPSANQSPAPDLTIEETQALDPADAGIPAQSQIVDFYVEAINGYVIPNPPTASDVFGLSLVDTSGVAIASHAVVQSGTDPILTMLASLKTDFDGDALPGFTFTVVSPNILRVESTTTEFVVRHWHYISPSGGAQSIPLRFIQTQPLVNGVSASEITPQQLKVTIGDTAFLPGAIYTLTATDLEGTEHTVEYESDVFDNRMQILNGLLLAIGKSSDEILNTIGTSLNTSEPSATLSLIRTLGVSAQVRPPASQYWSLVPFPDALMQPVVRGAGAALMAEWGQTATASIEEQKVPMETKTSSGDFDTTPNAPLTNQTRPYSRYKIQ